MIGQDETQTKYNLSVKISGLVITGQLLKQMRGENAQEIHPMYLAVPIERITFTKICSFENDVYTFPCSSLVETDRL